MNQAPTYNIDRRSFLTGMLESVGGIALATLLAKDRVQAGDQSTSQTGVLGGVLHHPAKAKRVVQLFMSGAASHIDLFDYKPELEKRHGEPSDFGEQVEVFQNGLGPWLKSP